MVLFMFVSKEKFRSLVKKKQKARVFIHYIFLAKEQKNNERIQNLTGKSVYF